MTKAKTGKDQLSSTHLPPISAVPILKFYDPGSRRLHNNHLLEAPVDDRGVGKVFDTLDLALSLVDPEYKWSLEVCDIHHFVWEKENYSIEGNNGDPVPLAYREISFHKGYLPSQLHNLIHAVVEPATAARYLGSFVAQKEFNLNPYITGSRRATLAA